MIDRKFYLVFAYPTTSGVMHVGHARSYTIPDAIARFKRMQGYDVFFPIGFHATGIDLQRIYEKISADPKEGLTYGVSPEIASKIKSPYELKDFFADSYIELFKKAAISVDPSTKVSTIDPPYNRFVQWQFRKLKEKGLLIQQDHRLPWCKNCDTPLSIDAAEADVSEWKGAKIKEYSIIKFGEEIKYAASTLRPETIYGVTNIWLNPDATYAEVSLDKERWLVSKEATTKLTDLNKDLSIEKTIKGKELQGHTTVHPLTKQIIPIHLADFVDPNEATGVVMSVPAHDPLDYMYLKQTDPTLSPIKVINIDADGIPAEAFVKKYKISDTHDKRLPTLVKDLYDLENKGSLLPNIPYIGGKSVPEARQLIAKKLDEMHLFDRIYELSVKPVYCRCGGEVIVKAVKDQWFINYGDPNWKNEVKRHIANMKFYPPQYKTELPGIIDWLEARPAVRRRGVGTTFPFDESWTIEALSDSTIYMAFYPISKYINEGRIKTEQLTDEFFDFIYLNEGNIEDVSKSIDIDKDTLIKVKRDFEYWYPLDMNCGGKEHKAVHFPFFIFHHVGIFPEKYWPKEIFVNWHLVTYGQKMSKHLGNVVFWDDAINKYGVDAVRLYLTHGSNQWTDFDWKNEEADSYVTHIRRFKNEVINFSKKKSITSSSGAWIDKWLTSRLNTRIEEVTRCMERNEIRKAVDTTFFQMSDDLGWYMQRSGQNNDIIRNFISAQLKMLYPFIPFTIKDLDMYIENREMNWPRVDKNAIEERTERIEESVKTTVEDVVNIKQLIRDKRKCHIYVTTEEEKHALNGIGDLLKRRADIDELYVYSIVDKKIYDPQNKSSKAKFLRPGIFLE